MENLNNTIFYLLEKSIKTYRQFAQRNLRANEKDLTIDQWLVLKLIQENPDLTQKELADQVFKDYASVTRIIDLLVKRNYLERSPNPTDRRRFYLQLTESAKNNIEKIIPIVLNNRKIALNGIPKEEIDQLYKTLNKIIENCNINSNDENLRSNP